MACSQAPDLANNVEALLVAVKSTRDFEAELAQRFSAAKPPEDAANVPLHSPSSAENCLSASPVGAVNAAK